MSEERVKALLAEAARHTCIRDDGGTPNRRCKACEEEEEKEQQGNGSPVCANPEDCCRELTRVWTALGVQAYTGKSASEHVMMLREENRRFRAALEDILTADETSTLAGALAIARHALENKEAGS